MRDRQRLARLVGELVQAHGGSQRASAKALGISQATLSRMLNGGLGAVSQAVASRLEQAALERGPREGRRLVEAIVSPQAHQLWRRGGLAWCLERRDRLVNRRGVYWSRESGRPPRPGSRKWRRNSRLFLLGQLIRKVNDAFPAEVRRFWEFCQGRGVSDVRYEVAHVRVVEPLVEFCESGYIERTWSELSSVERKQFVKAGYRRERIMLTRDHDLERAQRLVNGE